MTRENLWDCQSRIPKTTEGFAKRSLCQQLYTPAFQNMFGKGLEGRTICRFLFLLQLGVVGPDDILAVHWKLGHFRSLETFHLSNSGLESTALFRVAEYGWKDAIENLLTMEENFVDSVDSTGRTVLSWAAAALTL